VDSKPREVVKPEVRFIIRADASTHIGTGHVLRCLTIAEELRARNLRVEFVGSVVGREWVTRRIEELGIRIFSPESDKFESSPFYDVLILDSYHLSEGDMFIQPRNWKKIVCLADLATPPYMADLYISMSPEIQGEVTRQGKTLVGKDYLLVRKSFREIRGTLKVPNDASPYVIITGGGSDATGFCKASFEILTRSDQDFKAFIFTDSMFDVSNDSRFEILPIGTELDQHLGMADLFLSAAGVSAWEFLTCGGALGVVKSVENQSQNYSMLTQNSWGIGLGKFSTSNGWHLDVEAFEALISNPNIRKELYLKTRKIFDGKGAIRVVDEILSLLS